MPKRGWKKVRHPLSKLSPRHYCKCAVPAGFINLYNGGQGVIVCINCRYIVQKGRTSERLGAL